MLSLFMANNRIKLVDRKQTMDNKSVNINPLKVATMSGSCWHNAGSPHNGHLY